MGDKHFDAVDSIEKIKEHLTDEECIEINDNFHISIENEFLLFEELS